jgi:Zn-dependent protease
VSRVVPAGKENRLGQKRPWAITPSPTFLVLIAAFLFCAVWILYRPEQARFLVFPFVLTGFLIGLCLHEFGHSIIAYFCGDRSVREKGYLTLDPLRYTDAAYSIVFPILIMAIGGIGLPGGAVYINTRLLRRRLYGSLVSAGGPLATAVVLALLVLALPATAIDPVLYGALSFLALLELTALLFNIIPCPGLDGWGIVEPFFPERVRQVGRRMAPIGPLIIVIALIAIPEVNNGFWDTIYTVCDRIGVDPRVAAIGFRLFQFWR